MAHDDILREISDSIRYGDTARAKELLAPLLRDQPTADLWVLAAQVAGDDAQMKAALNKALELDPNHELARRTLDALNAMSPSVPPAPPADDPAQTVAPDPATPPPAPANPTGEGVYEMLWDCKYCSTTKLLGLTHRFCPNCGATQDPEWRYFPADDEKVAVHDHVFVGADHNCPACDTLMPAHAEFCTRCGAPQTEEAKAKMRVRTFGERRGDRFERQDLHERQRAEFEQMTGRNTPKARGSGRRGLIIAAVVIAAVVGVIALLTASRETTVYASGFAWERTIEVERKDPVTGRSECAVMPPGAYSVSRRTEQVGTRRVPDGEVCTNRQVDQGDGTFRQVRDCQTRYREEPVMGLVCYYTVDLWQNNRTLKTEGDKTSEPRWPDVQLARVGDCRGCEREGDRNERYFIALRGEGDATYTCAVDRAVWEATAPERVFRLEIATVGGGARCNTLEPVN